MEYKKRIMIVDDNVIDQMITSRILKLNYTYGEIVTMMSAAEALEYLDQHINEPSLLPNLILLDLDMPSINGFGFLERFNKYTSAFKNACPIVVLTASQVVNDVEKIKSHPDVVKLIAKPLDKDSLTLVV
jgi:CheY-like chemotaxis protein